MQVIIVGTGKLATELLSSLAVHNEWQINSWEKRRCSTNRSIVIHAGSGRELAAAASYCEATHSPLIELSTGSELEFASPAFPVVLCPNTNILMLKFMSLLKMSGPLFLNNEIELAESHQALKASVPGTAVNIAYALGLEESDIRSVRDSNVQRAEFQIPEEHLSRHAYHQIVIKDSTCSLKFEARVYGESPYAKGVSQIVEAGA